MSAGTDSNREPKDLNENDIEDVQMGGTFNVIGGRVGGLQVIDVSDDNEELCRCDEANSNSAAAVKKGKAKVNATEVLVLDSNASKFASLFRDAQRNATKLRASYTPTYTPLQRWKFENGLPVDGVSDVQTWAVAVGLARDLANSLNQSKKKMTEVAEEPPKYGNSTFTITELYDDDQKKPSPFEDQENSKDALLECRRKGKDKEDNLQD